jgi:hypothetical protein
MRYLLSSSFPFQKYKNQDTKTVILHVVFYGCKVWFLTLRVLKNMVLREIFCPNRDEAGREWRRLHNEELHHVYSFPHIILVIKSRRRR